MPFLSLTYILYKICNIMVQNMSHHDSHSPFIWWRCQWQCVTRKPEQSSMVVNHKVVWSHVRSRLMKSTHVRSRVRIRSSLIDTMITINNNLPHTLISVKLNSELVLWNVSTISKCTFEKLLKLKKGILKLKNTAKKIEWVNLVVYCWTTNAENNRKNEKKLHLDFDIFVTLVRIGQK